MPEADAERRDPGQREALDRLQLIPASSGCTAPGDTITRS